MGVFWSSSEWLDDKDLFGVSSVGGCTLEAFPLLFSFPFLVNDLNFMWGESSLGVCRFFV
jgi:hypothetical protein